MAHLIKLTDYQSQESILYNLDTVVSMERVKDSTVITTRWGRTQVTEALDDIITVVDHHLDNLYIRFGANTCVRQVVGIPMGSALGAIYVICSYPTVKINT